MYQYSGPLAKHNEINVNVLQQYGSEDCGVSSISESPVSSPKVSVFHQKTYELNTVDEESREQKSGTSYYDGSI